MKENVRKNCDVNFVSSGFFCFQSLRDEKNSPLSRGKSTTKTKKFDSVKKLSSFFDSSFFLFEPTEEKRKSFACRFFMNPLATCGKITETWREGNKTRRVEWTKKIHSACRECANECRRVYHKFTIYMNFEFTVAFVSTIIDFIASVRLVSSLWQNIVLVLRSGLVRFRFAASSNSFFRSDSIGAKLIEENEIELIETFHERRKAATEESDVQFDDSKTKTKSNGKQTDNPTNRKRSFKQWANEKKSRQKKKNNWARKKNNQNERKERKKL